VRRIQWACGEYGDALGAIPGILICLRLSARLFLAPRSHRLGDEAIVRSNAIVKDLSQRRSRIDALIPAR